jgi:hypothetical protein
VGRAVAFALRVARGGVGAGSGRRDVEWVGGVAEGESCCLA